MEINIHHIPETGLSFEGSVSAEELEFIDGERVYDSTPAVCDFNAEMTKGNLVVKGDATVVLDCKCDRCLEKTEVPIHVDNICIVVENAPDIVDLTNDIREDILLAFPQIYLCGEDCKGLCFSCGKNLNKEECRCDYVQENKSPWEALNNIEFKDDTGD